MRRYAFRPWLFKPSNYKHAELYLEEMAFKGYLLEGISRNGIGFACFRKITPCREFSFCADVFCEKDYSQLQYEEYLDICKSAGWNHIAERQDLQIFIADEGAKPVPLQSDPALEIEMIKKRYFKSELLEPVLTLLVLLGFLILCIPTSKSLLVMPGAIIPVVFSILFLLVLIQTLVKIRTFMRINHAYNSGSPIPLPKRRDVILLILLRPLLIFPTMLACPLIAIAAAVYYNDLHIALLILVLIIGIDSSFFAYFASITVKEKFNKRFWAVICVLGALLATTIFFGSMMSPLLPKY